MTKAIAPAPTPAPLSLTASDGTGLRLVALVARGVVEEPLAFTELHLSFDNPESRTIEGHFDITLPPGATISRFAMRQPSGWQEGEVVELQAARRAYEDFLHRKQDPALMEKQPGNHFRARVFPIPPAGRKELLVSYSQERPSAEDPYRIHLRGLPVLERLDIRVIVSTCETTATPGTAAGALGGTTVSQRTVKLNRTDVTPDADFEVAVPAPASGVQVGLRHGNLVVARVLPAAERRPDLLTDLTVLFDTSASRGLGFAQQVDLLSELVTALRAQHRDLPLRLCCFDQEVVEIFRGPLSALQEHHLQSVRERGALGASDLSRALAAVADPAGPRCTRVLLISDGIATAGPTEGSELRAAAQRLRAAGVERLDALVCGGIRDEDLLKGLASGGLVRDGVVVDGTLPVAQVLHRLSEATLSGVRVSVPGSQWVWPTRLDGVQSGDQVLVYADLAPERPFAVVLADAAPLSVPLAEAERPLLERAWVNARIRKLLHQRDTMADGDPDLREALRRQVIELSTRHRVLSDFTALLVLETEEDYARFGIDRRALSDILTVGPTGVEVLHRKQAAPPLPREVPRPELRAAKLDLAHDEDDVGVPLDAEAEVTGRTLSELAMPQALYSADSAPAAESESAPPIPSAPEPVRAEPSVERSRAMSPPAPSPARKSARAPAEMARPRPAPGAMPPPSAAAPAPDWAAPRMAPPPAAQAMAPPQVEASEAVPMPSPAAGRSIRLSTSTSTSAASPPSASAPPPAAAAPSLWNRVAQVFRREASDEAPAPPPPPPPPPAARPVVAPARPQMEERARVVTPSAPSAPPAQPTQPTQPEASLPYQGPLLEVMRLLRQGQLKQALAAALRWQTESPGDVLALIALGEALEALGQPVEAARVYGSIIDLFPGRADLRRFAGERLDRLGAAGLALAVDTYRKAREQRPDHPASHRLLGFALLRAGEPAEAFAVLAEGARRSYPPERFPGVPRILKEDVGLLAAAWIHSAPGREAEVRSRAREEGAVVPSEPSLRFVLNWETDANDVDFHIHDGRGGHAYYRSRTLPSGGELYADVTTGYGPECFTIPGQAAAYPYKLQAHYYSRGPMGYGMGKLEIIQHDGQGGLRFEQRPFVIMEDRAFVDLGEVTKPL